MSARNCLLVALGLAATLSAQSSVYARLDLAPNPDAVMAWDGARQRVVAYERGPAGGLWEWDGQRWAMRIGAGAAPLQQVYAGVYEPARRDFLLVGNTAARWGGARWAQVSGLSTRPGAQLVFDSRRNRLIEYYPWPGGTMMLREWNGTAWNPVPMSGPPFRGGAALAYDPTNQRTVLYGGTTGGTTSRADCWSWDGTTWTRLAAAAPPGPRSGASLAHDPVAGRLVLYGGYSGSLTTWTLTGTMWSQVNTTANPGPTLSGGMVWDGTGMLLYGADRDQLWRLENGDWRLLGREPVRRVHAAVAYDYARQELVMFGGRLGSPWRDTWTYDGVWHAGTQTTSPSRRQGAGMAWSAVSGTMLLFGGLDGSTLFDDTWSWNGADWTRQAPATSPPPQAFPAISQDPRGGVLLFGASGTINEQWYWDGVTWTRGTQPLPQPLLAVAVAGYDPVRQRTLLFGRTAATPQQQSMWEWDGQRWSPIGLPPQIAVYPHGICYRPDTGRMLLDGFLERWEWDGVRWFGPQPTTSGVRAHVPVAAPRFGGVLAYPISVVSSDDAPSLALLTATPAEAARYGIGCALVAIPALSLRGRMGPRYPAAELRAVSGAPRAPALFALGLTRRNLPLGPGCALLVDRILGTHFALTDANGEAGWTMPVPPSRALLGVALFAQGATLDPPNSVYSGITLTRGLRIAIGD